MSAFVLKIIACITMVLDHIKYVAPETKNFITMYMGRISFPLFAFFITEGYTHTKDLKKYYERLIIFAIISQLPFLLFRSFVGTWKGLNIIVTLILGLITITIYDKCKNKILAPLGIICVIALGNILKVDYGSFGVALIFVIYTFKNQKIALAISYLTVLIIHLGRRNEINFEIENILVFIGYSIPLIFIFLYNKMEGKKLKYFYYWFYPVHMLILVAIGYYLGTPTFYNIMK